MASPATTGVTPASVSAPGPALDTDGSMSRTASASSSSSSPSVQITSDIPEISSAPPAPAASAAPTISNAAPSSRPAPTIHGPGRNNNHGFGIDTAGPITGLTSRNSPALPSSPVVLSRPTSATAIRLSPAAAQPSTQSPESMASGLGKWRAQVPLTPQPTKSPAPIKPSISKVPITEPPASGTRRQAGIDTFSGFPSPGRENMQKNPKFLDDRTRITYGIQQSIPDAVRRSVRENWEKCLLGSDFHQAFILNASIHHATPAAIRRGMRDFGKALIAAAKHSIVDQMTVTDIDALSDQILAKASNSFLDRALELRIKTIEAVPLINALARAERLGYESSDVVEEPDNRSVAPTQPVQQRNLPSSSSSTPHPTQIIHQPALSAVPMHCGICFRKFNHQSSYEHHVKGKVCTRSPNSPGGFKFSCQHCGQGFTTVMGLQYHNANKVCGDFGEPTKVARKMSLVPAPTPAPSRVVQRGPIPVTPATATVKSTPKAPASVDSRSGIPGLHTPSGAVANPYSHLSPEQLIAMQQELRDAEIMYSERMRQATTIPDEAEKKQRLDGLSNSFGTKQSLIRKKYGVRLRMRRTKAEIQSERDRMQYKTAAELVADIGLADSTPRRIGRPPSSAQGPRGHLSTKASTNNQAAAQQTSKVEEDPRTTNVSMHYGNKRRYSGSNTDSPNHKRVAYAQMAGLSGTAAVAEMEDPTLPPKTSSTPTFVKGRGTEDQPMALDTDDSDSEDSGDDEDIPAQLPASVRQTLQRSSSAALGSGSSRPGSSSAK